MSHPVSSICQKLILFLRFLKKEKGTEPAVKKWIAASLPQFFHIFPTCHTPILALCHTPDLAIYVTLTFLLYMSHSHSCYIYVTLAFLLYICHTPILAIYMSHSQSCSICHTPILAIYMSHSHSCYICHTPTLAPYMSQVLAAETLGYSRAFWDLRQAARSEIWEKATALKVFFFRAPTHFSHMSHPTFPISHL